MNEKKSRWICLFSALAITVMGSSPAGSQNEEAAKRDYLKALMPDVPKRHRRSKSVSKASSPIGWIRRRTSTPIFHLYRKT